MLRARLAQHEVELVEVDPAELGIDAAARALGNPGGHFRASPEAAVGCGSSDGHFKLVLLSWGKIRRSTARIDAVLVNHRLSPQLVVALKKGANPVAMEADQFGHLTDRLACAEEPQGVPSASLFWVVAAAVALFQLFRAQVRR